LGVGGWLWVGWGLGGLQYGSGSLSITSSLFCPYSTARALDDPLRPFFGVESDEVGLC
jgi:hypothetical protein